MLRLVGARLSATNIVFAGMLWVCFVCPRLGGAQAASAPPNALNRLLALRLSRVDGAVPVYYSAGRKAQALRDQAEITDCAAWYSHHLHVSVPVTLAVLTRSDWDRVGGLMGYPMAQALADQGNVIFMPDSFASFPGQKTHVDLDKKLDFIAFHETGHLYQRVLHLEGPDLFMQEFSATMLATAYALSRRPELIGATLGSRTDTPQRFTSFEDMDLIYEGVGFDNYDWLQVETVRLAVYFVKGQDLAALVRKLQAAFPAGRPMSNQQVFASLDAIRPGVLAQAGSLANPTTLKPITPAMCLSAPRRQESNGFFGVRNESNHDIAVVDDGTNAVLPPGYVAEYGKVGSQLKLPSGQCITYAGVPGYIVLR